MNANVLELNLVITSTTGYMTVCWNAIGKKSTEGMKKVTTWNVLGSLLSDWIIQKVLLSNHSTMIIFSSQGKLFNCDWISYIWNEIEITFLTNALNYPYCASYIINSENI